ncbi:hypothetical protein GCM10028820_00700 [Tessaracoccus terricola]
MKRILSTCAAGALVLGGSILATQPAQAAEPPSYSVMLLQPAAGHVTSEALGLNDAGDVVGWSGTEGNIARGTLWTSRSNRGVTLGAGYGMAVDISGTGVILGQSYAGDRNPYWYQHGSVASFELREESEHFARGISESGVALIQSASGMGYTATAPNALTQQTPPAGSTPSQVMSISPNGRFVAGQVYGGGATLWVDGNARLLGSGTGSVSNEMTAVNDAGTSVECRPVSTTWPTVRGTRIFSATGDVTDLAPLAGSDGTCAQVINNDGVIAGGAGKQPAVWVDGKAYALNSLVPRRVGFALQTVNDINASGQLVGMATLDDGSKRGYIATPSTAETIYTTPGYHHFNGRDWKTACEPYSQTTRCRTEIIATQVIYSGGTYTRVTDWAFNNLTYNPSPRTQWANNPLGKKGEWTADDGRKWRTECDTTNTGRNGCRSYVQARVADATPKPSGGYTYTVTTKWVFNNIVKFS